MIIHHRGLYHDRLDAPFVGSLLFAVDCHHACPNCCHEGRHDGPITEEEIEEIFYKIQDYKFSQGLILGGFEWTESPEEMYALIEFALAARLGVILYTHHTERELLESYAKLYEFSGLYIKVGEYREDLKSQTHSSFGIPLASTNQYIIQIQ
jgi:pyruvate-formate lyase-activating enzyme